ncbi:MAG: tetratricopeptide repeat protein [Acidobacteria bacterium]|nr:tetratricopeptide repeat protein [Acidobacteriota bacterium]
MLSKIKFSAPDLTPSLSAYSHHLALFAVQLVLAQSIAGSAAFGQSAQTLELGKPIEKRLAGGESHSYSVTISAGQFLRAVIEQRGIDVAVTLFAPNGRKLLEVDSPNGDEGPEPVSWIAETSGNHRIEVRSGDKQARPGRYEARVETLRAATEADRIRVGAELAVMEAEHLFDGDVESKRRAARKFEDALQLWRRLDDQPGAAGALTAMGDLHMALNERPKALELYLQALPIWRALRNSDREGATLNHIGAAYDMLGEKQRALDYFQQALPLRRAANNKAGEAVTFTNLGKVYSDLGEKRKALDFYNQALPLFRVVSDKASEATILNNIAQVFRDLGEKRKALGYYNQSLMLSRAINHRNLLATTLSNIGVVYSDLGEIQRALDNYNQSLSLRSDPRGRATTFNNLGRAYDLLGAPQEALNYYNQSLQLARSAPDKRIEGLTLNYIGLVHWQSGDYRSALESLNQALGLRRETRDRAGEAATLNNIGLVHDAMGERRKALDTYTRALPIIRGIADRQGEAYTLNNIGFVYDALGDRQRALQHHEQGLKLSRDVGDRLREAKIRYGIARIESQRNNLKGAREQIEQTIRIVESLRSKLASQELRAAYRASTQRYYELYIDVLMRLGRRAPRSNLIAEAFQASERARARSLIELLTEAGADIREGVDTRLVERERELQDQINDKTTEQIRLLMGKNTAAQIAALAEEIERSVAELRDAQAQIRQNSPRYAALTQPRPLTAREIQRNLLDANTMLLEYSLGAERSYLWALTRNSILSFTLPKREEIESRARRYYELVTAPGRSVPNESNQKRQARLANAAAESRQIAAWLSRKLLGPVAAEIGSKRLIIVADGALQYTPFAALPTPRTEGQKDGETERQRDRGTERQGDRGTGRQGDRGTESQRDRGTEGQRDRETLRSSVPPSLRPSVPPSPRPSVPPSLRLSVSPSPLIVRHEIVNLPSASTLDVLRREMTGKPKAANTVAVIADPVFEAGDERVKRVEIKADQPDEKKTIPAPSEPPGEPSRILLVKSARDSGASAGFSIPRLPNTRIEAEAILSLDSSRSGGAGRSVFDFAANRAAATGADLGQYRIIHLATHGFLNSLNPELSGLAFSLVDEKGSPQNGFLLAPEIYNLKLPVADLIVLSACQTGLGKEVRGEGVVGLTRGFMYAGAPRVVVSLWNVNDRATADLMKRFYQGMLVKGLRPAAALRAAQIELLKLPEWRAPYYWAAFGLQGEWR